MKIAIDARELCGKRTGVGRYLAELLTEWTHAPEAGRHEWRLYTPVPTDAPGAFASRITVIPGAGGTAWEQWTLARALAAERPDVLFAPGYSAPLTAPCPTVVAIHDVSFAARPEWFSPREGLRRRVLARWSARRARLVLTISRFSQAEIVQHLGVPATRVRVTLLGTRRPACTGSAREPIVLFVGSIFERRHVDRLVEAFVTEVATAVPDARLEVVGDNRLPSPASIGRSLASVPESIRSRVRFRSYVDEATLEDLYARAAVFAFLSEYEGFGLTPLEAMARGVAPVVLDTPVSREIYGPAAEYVVLGPTLRADLGRTLVRLLVDVGARQRLVGLGPAVLDRYDWSRTAAETLRVLEEAAGAR